MLYKFTTIIRNPQNSIGNYSGSYITLDCTTESSPLTSQSGWKPAEIGGEAFFDTQTDRKANRQTKTYTHTHTQISHPLREGNATRTKLPYV